MKNYIEQMIERRESLLLNIKSIQEDLIYADGGAYSQDRQRISKLQNEINSINAEVHRYTFFGPEFPEWVRSQRNREIVDKARKIRLESALIELEKLFGR